MPERGPVCIEFPESADIYGLKGPSSDSDFTELHAKQGEKGFLEKVPGGYVSVSTKDGNVFVPISVQSDNTFQRVMPSDKQVLRTQTTIIVGELPDFLKAKLSEMVEAVTK